MPSDDGAPSHYPCLMQKDGLHRVHDSRDERPVAKALLLRTWSRLVAALRRNPALDVDA